MIKYGKYIVMLILLTVADDSTQRISLEVKLNVHVLSLWRREQHLEQDAHLWIERHFDKHRKEWVQNSAPAANPTLIKWL